jgi:hypothetical protein
MVQLLFALEEWERTKNMLKRKQKFVLVVVWVKKIEIELELDS